MDFDSNLASALHMCAVQCPEPGVAILTDLNVCEWLCGGGDALWGSLPCKDRAGAEKAWGLSIKARYCDKKAVNDWSGDLAETAVKALCILRGWAVLPKRSYPIRTHPDVKQKHTIPDVELEHAVIECKTQSYFTTGSAWEKYAFAPYKYTEVVELTGKPAYIICFAKAEEYLITEYFAPTPYRIHRRNEDAYVWNVHWVRGTDFIRWVLYW
jgi:hypothetical protein